MAAIVAAIAAMSENRVIGRAGGMPWRIPEDMKHFKATTMGKPCIMGRKTFESFGAKPLPGRDNIIVSRGSYQACGARVFPDIGSALAQARKVAERAGVNEIMIIGGGQIYEQALPVTARIYLTIIHKIVDGDTFFPELDPNQWRETSHRDSGECSYITLERN